MTEEQLKSNLDRIEKVIVDGQKDIKLFIDSNQKETNQHLEKTNQRLEETNQRLDKLENKFDYLDKKIDHIDKKHDTNANALYGLLKDVQKDLGRVEDKLDLHMRQPAHI